MGKNRYCMKCLKDKALYDLIYSDYEYRNLDGTGNSKNGKGRAGSNLSRKGPPAYEDGISNPAGKNRTSARVISNEIHNQIEKCQNKNLSSYLWLWGQFIDHTMSLTESGKSEDFNIQVPKGDQYFDPKSEGDKEIKFKRSIYDKKTGTDIKNPRQQINLISSFIDASLVYGNDKKRNNFIRTFYKGRIKTSNGFILPCTDGNHHNEGDAGKNIFLAGDVRCNEHLGLIAMHNLFVREHNYWASKIYKKCPKMCDEEIYQKAKIIVEAEIQAITFNEFLPCILGSDILKPYTGYNPDVDPSIDIEFSTAAFRFGHSLVASDILRLNKKGCPIKEGNLKLKDVFFRPDLIMNEQGIEPILFGYTLVPSQKLDGMIVDDLRNFLFGKPGKGGLDLASLNIQRGRDHGLSDYNTMRNICGFNKINHFNELTSNPTLALKLKSLYDNVNDIDLWTGGLLEEKFGDSMLGPTFHTIVKSQFERLRDGDKFWYENRLTNSQIKLINNTKLSDILKRNTYFDIWPSNVFKINKLSHI